MFPRIRRLLSTWNRRDYLEIAVLLGVIALMHLVGFATLVFVIAPHHYRAGAQIFGFGLGATAYLFGLRHAFDADHIAAIDNTTRKLMTDGQRPKAVGFWFAMGHSTLVLVMAVLVMVGAHAVGALADDHSSTRHVLGFAGTLASGLFLYLIAIMNVIAMIGIYRAFVKLRHGSYSDLEIEAALNDRGLFARLLRPVMNRITRPVQLYPVGALFGLGFDTATEVALLALAGSGAGCRPPVVRGPGGAVAIRGRHELDGHPGRTADDGGLMTGRLCSRCERSITTSRSPVYRSQWHC